MTKLLITTLIIAMTVMVAYAVNIAPGGTVTQDFSIGTTQTATLPTDWKADKNSSARTLGSYSSAVSATEQYAGNSMSSSAANGIYNYGAGVYNVATDRAVGGISSKSSSKSVNVYVKLTNNGAAQIPSFTISYNVEKYRMGTNAAGFSIQMYYSTNGSSWTSAGTDFLTSFAGGDASNDGYASAPGATSSVTSKTLSQTLAVSGDLYLAWNYSVTSGTTTSNAQALGIDDVSIIAGSGGVSAPTTQASGITFSSVGQTGMTVNWTSGNGSKRIVIMNTSNSFSNPTDGTDPTADDSWNNSGEQVVYNNSSNTVPVTGLTASTTYWYRVYEYNGSGATTKYLTSTATDNPKSQATTSGVVLPTVTTTAITAITTIAASGGGNVTADGGASISDRGICWGTSSNPTTSNSTYSNGAGSTGSYTSPLASLTANQLYHVRAYAINSAGTAYGDDVTFTTLKTEPSNHVTSFAAGTTTVSTIPLTWTDATADGYLIKGSDIGYDSITPPSDGTAETNDLLVRNVTQGTQTYTFPDLNSGTTYYFKIYPYTNSGTGIDYKTNDTIPQASAVTKSMTVLAPGDIAIIGFQSDTPDQFAFVTFVDILEGTQIKFTDNAWDGTALKTTEGTVTWTAPTDVKDSPAGTVVVVTAGTPWTVTSGTGTVTTSGSPAFAVDGDQLIAYQGASTSPTLLYALSTTSWLTEGTTTSNSTYLPTGLTDGTTAIAFSSGIDNVFYTTAAISGTPAQILALVGDVDGWTQSDTYQSFPAWDVDEETLPVVLSSFSAILTSQNKVNVLWVTQTETNLTGFYILRADSEDVADAELISALIEPNNNSQQQTYVYSDNSLVEPGTYYYWLQVAEMDGNSALHGPTSINYTNQDNPGIPGVPLVTELKSVFPNPFNPTTTISYGIATATDVNFTIYNARGQVVRTVSKGVQAPNNYRLTWNGTDNNGKECSTGIYYIKMQAGKDSFVRKAVLMK